jgi:hypothetical protein
MLLKKVSVIVIAMLATASACCNAGDGQCGGAGEGEGEGEGNTGEGEGEGEGEGDGDSGEGGEGGEGEGEGEGNIVELTVTADLGGKDMPTTAALPFSEVVGGAAGGFECVAVTVPAGGQRIVASATNNGCVIDEDGYDVIIEAFLVSDLAVVVASNDDGGDGQCSLFDDVLDEGAYALCVRGYDDESPLPGTTFAVEVGMTGVLALGDDCPYWSTTEQSTYCDASQGQFCSDEQCVAATAALTIAATNITADAGARVCYTFNDAGTYVFETSGTCALPAADPTRADTFVSVVSGNSVQAAGDDDGAEASDVCSRLTYTHAAAGPALACVHELGDNVALTGTTLTTTFTAP